MKIIDNYLDGYFAKKVIALACNHLQSLKIKPVVNYDAVLQEWLIEGFVQKDNKYATLTYLRLPRSKAPEELFSLLAKGWWELDAGFNLEYQKVIEGIMPL